MHKIPRANTPSPSGIEVLREVFLSHCPPPRFLYSKQLLTKRENVTDLPQEKKKRVNDRTQNCLFEREHGNQLDAGAGDAIRSQHGAFDDTGNDAVSREFAFDAKLWNHTVVERYRQKQNAEHFVVQMEHANSD